MNRAFILISGADRVSFLQGILTQDVTQLETIQFAAMLSPQGKILHDMFLVAQPDAILIDTPAIHAPTLLKRLAMYKLRAKVTIADVSDQWRVTLGTDGLPDPRHAALPRRLYSSLRGGLQADVAIQQKEKLDCHVAYAPRNDGHHSPLSLGIPDSAIDFAPDEITAMDAGYDLLNAISFTKGCYVGQEVTARMHYKAIARKGFFIVEGEQELRSGGAALMLGDKQVGTLRSADGTTGLAFLKFEDAFSSTPMLVENSPVRLTAPGWMQPKITQFRANATAQ